MIESSKEKPSPRRPERTSYLCMIKLPEIKKHVTVIARNAKEKVFGARKENAEICLRRTCSPP